LVHVQRNMMNSNVRTSIIAIFIIVLGLLAFWPAFYNGFTNWDDQYLVSWNPLVTELSWNSVRDMFSSFSVNHYLPLTLFSYAVEFHFYGWNPIIYHVTNVLIHALNGVLVFWLLMLLTKHEMGAVLGALLWLLHPLRVESVAWIAERKDVLSALFYLSSLILYINYRKTEKRSYVYSSVGLFLASLLCKATAVTLPIVFVAYDFVCDGKLVRKKLLEKMPMLVLSVVFGVVAVLAQYSTGVNPKDPSFDPIHGVFVACYNVLFYLGKGIAPLNLSPFYPYPETIQKGHSILFWISPGVLLLAGWLWWRFLRRNTMAMFGLFLFLVPYLLVAQIIPVGRAIAADRFTYLPFVGVSLWVALGWQWIDAQSSMGKLVPSIVRIVIAGGVLGLLIVLTQQQCRIWKNGVSLWSVVIERYPNYAEAYNNRGISWAARWMPEEGLKDLDVSVRLDATDPFARFNRGLILQSLERDEEAVTEYSALLNLSPSDVEGWIRRGFSYSRLKRHEEALRDYEQALRLAPDAARALEGRDQSMKALGRAPIDTLHK
jgi:protein O-mannosyl-transferase